MDSVENACRRTHADLEIRQPPPIVAANRTGPAHHRLPTNAQLDGTIAVATVARIAVRARNSLPPLRRPEPDFGDGIEHPNPNEVAAAGLNNPVVLAAKLPNATQTSPSPAPSAQQPWVLFCVRPCLFR